MPKVTRHAAISKERTGYGFLELHSWIDEGAEDIGVDHRKERHYFNLKDKEAIEGYWGRARGPGWGSKAVIEWLFHIALDNLETAYKLSLAKSCYGPKTYKRIEVIFKPRGNIDCNFD